ncbi:MAG: DUF2461 domain-containing protein [Bacteroidia bacterium]
MIIEKSTFDFLKALKKNNDREWFAKNKDKYELAKQNFEDFVTELIKQCAKFDKRIEGLDVKKSIFRIYRDVRFSKNKDPYKSNLSAAISIGGRKGEGFGFYVQVGPGVSFMGGGAWMPEGDKLKKIRQEIDYNILDFKDIVNDKKFKKFYGVLMQDHKLVNPPKGYDKTHPEIELLKLNSFVAGIEMDDATVLDKNFLKKCVEGYKLLMPFNDFLNTAIA